MMMSKGGAVQGALTVARAPGRLDVMGGIADYGGSLVLQLPLALACHVAVQLQPPAAGDLCAFKRWPSRLVAEVQITSWLYHPLALLKTPETYADLDMQYDCISETCTATTERLNMHMQTQRHTKERNGARFCRCGSPAEHREPGRQPGR